jgi:hypothetical protein
MVTLVPKRRWFAVAFSLRGLFMAVAAVACSLAYLVDWRTQRKDFLHDQQLQYVAIYRATKANERQPRLAADLAQHFVLQPTVISVPAPRLLRFFGEQGERHIHIIVNEDDVKSTPSRSWKIASSHPKIQKAKRLFPEAIIYAYLWDRSYVNGPDFYSVRIAD